MRARIAIRISQWEQALRRSFGNDIVTPRGRRLSWIYTEFFDHAVLRRLWHNFDQVAPGVFRSNHPNHARLARYRARGILTVLNLRGVGNGAPYLFEAESCRALGLTLVSVSLSARKAPERDQLLALFAAFRNLPRPFVMHCKSGADRAGLAAALYLLAQDGASVAVARRQLSFRYFHIKSSKTGILDHFLDLYEQRLASGPIGIEAWVGSEYDSDALTASFARQRGKAAGGRA